MLTRSLSDCLPLLRIAGRTAGYPAIVVMGMGPAGLPTRILAAHFGSCWTYAGDAAGGGPDSTRTAARRVRVPAHLGRDRHLRPRRVAVDAHASRRPCTTPRSGRRRANAVYVPLAASSADDFVTFARAIGVKGRQRDDSVQDRPVRSGGRTGCRQPPCRGRQHAALHGDAMPGGATRTSRGSWRPSPRGSISAGPRAVILGAGGAARAVAVALASAGASVAVHARDARKAGTVAQLVGGQAGAMPPPPGSWDLLVNATPLGTFPRVHETPFEHGVFDGRLVYDLVYNPPRTRLLREAAAAGCRRPGRARDAGRAGAAAVGVVDRISAASAPAARCRAGGSRPVRGGPVGRDEADIVRHVRGTGPARDVRAGLQGDRRGPADARVGVPEDRRALRLRVPARERGRRRARGPVLVPRQGSVPAPARAGRADHHRARRRDDGAARSRSSRRCAS